MKGRCHMFDLAYTLESYDLVPATEGIKDVAKKVWGAIIEKIKRTLAKIRAFVGKHKKSNSPSSPNQNRLKAAWKKWFDRSKKLTRTAESAVSNPDRRSYTMEELERITEDVSEASEEVTECKKRCSDDEIIDLANAFVADAASDLFQEIERVAETVWGMDRTNEQVDSFNRQMEQDIQNAFTTIISDSNFSVFY